MVSSTAAIRLDWTHTAMLVGRLCISAIFLFSGVGKLMAPAATIAGIQSVGLPFPELGLALAVGVELLCGAALLTGFKVRWAASILAAFSIATAIFFHSAFADPNQVTHFLKNVAITGGLLHVIVLGAGARPRARSFMPHPHPVADPPRARSDSATLRADPRRR
jgi:putative oxidoreductase